MSVPTPTKDSPREEKTAWLQSIDCNGAFTDKACENMCLPPMTDEEAWAMVLDFLQDDEESQATHEPINQQGATP